MNGDFSHNALQYFGGYGERSLDDDEEADTDEDTTAGDVVL